MNIMPMAIAVTSNNVNMAKSSDIPSSPGWLAFGIWRSSVTASIINARYQRV
jgi:hypothetical protein